MAKKITFAFGRFNPVTIGHEVLMDKAASVGGKNYRIYISHSQDRKKNPLDFKTKLKYMKKIFPVHAKKIQNSKIRTAIEVAVELYDEGYTDLIMIAGSDRVGEFQKLLDEYNGVEGKRHGFYKFDTIKVISAGERDPDAEGASGMSASKMRGAAADDNFELFQTGLPDTFANSKDAKILFRTLQKAMGIKSFKEAVDEGKIMTAIKNKAYKLAAKYYIQYKKRGDNPGVALHKAAGTVKGVNDKDLQMYLTRLKLL